MGLGGSLTQGDFALDCSLPSQASRTLWREANLLVLELVYLAWQPMPVNYGLGWKVVSNSIAPLRVLLAGQAGPH